MSKFCTIKSNDITIGRNLMERANNLVSWDSDLNLLVDGYRMFYHCSALTNFKANTPNLTNGNRMFCPSGDGELDERTIRLSADSLQDGTEMFFDECYNDTHLKNLKLRSNHQLQSAWGFPALTTGVRMFCNCSSESVQVYSLDNEYGTGLSYLDFPELINGQEMFAYCKVGSFYGGSFPKCVNFYGMFANSDIEYFSAAGIFENVENGGYLPGYTDLNGNSNYFATFRNMFYNCSALETFSTEYFSPPDSPWMYDGIDGTRMFAKCYNLLSISDEGGLFSYITNCSEMFSGCSSLSQFDANISSIKSGYYMFARCANLTSFTSDLTSLTNGQSMFARCANLTSFTSDLTSLTNGQSMFYGCSNLTSFTSDLYSLTNGYNMFARCANLTNFNSVLSYLTDGDMMFYDCVNLTSFTSELYRLTDGYFMFSHCSALTTFTSDLSSLTDGNGMFYYCSRLNTFNADLSSLGYGYCMFASCSELTSFNSDLRSLTNGFGMFENCKLNESSIQNIANTINDVTDISSKPVITIGAEHSLEELTDTERMSLATIMEKGWTVQFGNTSNELTLEQLQHVGGSYN